MKKEKQEYKTEPMIIKNTQRDIKEINIDGHVIPLDNKHHQNFLSDKGLAREIDARYGKNGEVSPKDFIVIPEVPRVTGIGHKYTFSVPELPWKRSKDAETNYTTQEETN